jgi:hypothetical protein
MSKQSEAVKKWRHNCKNRVIASMGGKCCICGYNKCFASLALHHLDPSEKDFSFGSIRANPKNWASLVVEIRKCVLVCHNCHNEIHVGMAVVPFDAPRFDESFEDYKSLEEKAEKILTPCPICGKLKPSHLVNCSLECAGRSRYKVDWDKLDLVNELKTKSIVQLAEEIGCSDAAIHKRLRKLGIK